MWSRYRAALGLAFALWDSVWGDVGDEPYPSLFTNLTGSTYTENTAASAPPPEFDYYADYINRPEVWGADVEPIWSRYSADMAPV